MIKKASQFLTRTVSNWMDNLSIDIATSAADLAAVKQIISEYLSYMESEFGENLCAQGSDHEFADFPNDYDALFLAKLDGSPVAACGFKRFTDEDCEIKRLYCRPQARGHDLGRKLTQKCIERGRASGFKRILLDTSRDLKAANAIYEKLGFVDIEKYFDNPTICSRYMALDL